MTITTMSVPPTQTTIVQKRSRKKREIFPRQRKGKDLFEKIIIAYYNCKNVWKQPNSPEILQVRRRYREQKHRLFDRIIGRRHHNHVDVYYRKRRSIDNEIIHRNLNKEETVNDNKHDLQKSLHVNKRKRYRRRLTTSINLMTYDERDALKGYVDDPRDNILQFESRPEYEAAQERRIQEFNEDFDRIYSPPKNENGYLDYQKHRLHLPRINRTRLPLGYTFDVMAKNKIDFCGILNLPENIGLASRPTESTTRSIDEYVEYLKYDPRVVSPKTTNLPPKQAPSLNMLEHDDLDRLQNAKTSKERNEILAQLNEKLQKMHDEKRTSVRPFQNKDVIEFMQQQYMKLNRTAKKHANKKQFVAGKKKYKDKYRNKTKAEIKQLKIDNMAKHLNQKKPNKSEESEILELTKELFPNSTELHRQFMSYEDSIENWRRANRSLPSIEHYMRASMLNNSFDPPSYPIYEDKINWTKAFDFIDREYVKKINYTSSEERRMIEILDENQRGKRNYEKEEEEADRLSEERRNKTGRRLTASEALEKASTGELDYVDRYDSLHITAEPNCPWEFDDLILNLFDLKPMCRRHNISWHDLIYPDMDGPMDHYLWNRTGFGLGGALRNAMKDMNNPEVMVDSGETESPLNDLHRYWARLNVASTTEPEPTEGEPNPNITLYDYDAMTHYNVENIRKIERKFNLSLKDLPSIPMRYDLTFGIRKHTVEAGFTGLVMNISSNEFRDGIARI